MKLMKAKTGRCTARPVEYDFVEWNGTNIDEVRTFTENLAFPLNGNQDAIKVLYRYNNTWQDCHRNDLILKTRSGYFRVIHRNDFERLYNVTQKH